MSEPKEIHYYAEETFNSKSLECYQYYFNTNSKIAGTTPKSYTKSHNKFYKNIPEKIFKDTPEVKLIYIVRDPIERYKSHILESYHCDIAEDILYSKESDNYLKTSLYGMQLKEYLRFFKKRQIHVLKLESLEENRLNELNRTFKFLELPTLYDMDLFDYVTNTAGTKRTPRILKGNYLYRIAMRLSPAVAKQIGEKLANLFFKNQLKKPNLSQQETELLISKMQADMIDFYKITGIKFSKFKYDD
ncbi:sulfotransferase domain-containing protein [Vicingaceae bacterium]|nr:sulfotransferase domain-containing protein [Vicingaceae bacterium]